MTQSFNAFCNEPAFPQPPVKWAGPVDEGVTIRRQPGLTKLEYFVAKMLLVMPPKTSMKDIARKNRMEQIFFFAEDMLYTIWKKQGGEL